MRASRVSASTAAGGGGGRGLVTVGRPPAALLAVGQQATGTGPAPSIDTHHSDDFNIFETFAIE